MADLVISNRGAPTLRNIRAISTPGLSFVESHGFSPDGRQIVFTGKKSGLSVVSDIYLLNLVSGKMSNITKQFGKAWNEHAQITPDGQSIIWMTNNKTVSPNGRSRVGHATDYWRMRINGSSPERLTHFDGMPGFAKRFNVASDIDIHPGGKEAVCFVQTKLDKTGHIVRFTLPTNMGYIKRNRPGRWK